MKGYRHFKYEDRLLLEYLLKKKIPKAEIARMMNCHPNTITNEYKRGKYIHTFDYYDKEMYSAELAESRYQENLKKRGTQKKIDSDPEYAAFLEQLILEKDFSPSAALGYAGIKTKKTFRTKVCVRTLYSYIDKGVFKSLSNKNLPVKGKRKRRYKKIRRQKKVSAGTSIDARPKKIDARHEFGHWEMDTVRGGMNGKKNLLVLTERKTRYELCFLLPNGEAKNVVSVLDELEKQYQDKFSSLFKSITVDNGSEFSAFADMEKSCFEGKRTSIYYCHAYCSWERGSNENQNKLVRRRIPKGSNFDWMTQEDVDEVQEWINNYPRKKFDWLCSNDLFRQEVELLL